MIDLPKQKNRPELCIYICWAIPRPITISFRVHTIALPTQRDIRNNCKIISSLWQNEYYRLFYKPKFCYTEEGSLHCNESFLECKALLTNRKTPSFASATHHEMPQWGLRLAVIFRGVRLAPHRKNDRNAPNTRQSARSTKEGALRAQVQGWGALLPARMPTLILAWVCVGITQIKHQHQQSQSFAVRGGALNTQPRVRPTRHREKSNKTPVRNLFKASNLLFVCIMSLVLWYLLLVGGLGGVFACKHRVCRDSEEWKTNEERRDLEDDFIFL